MVRLSEIFKKINKEEGQEKLPISQEEIKSSQEAPKQEKIDVAKAVTEGLKQEKPEQELQIAQVIKDALLDEEEAEHLYQKAMDLARTILERLAKKEKIEIGEIDNIVRIIVDQLVLDNKKFIALVSTNSSDNYLYAHFINVAILSIEVGLGLKYNKSQLNELGLDAFLHDVGMSKVLDLALAPRVLNEEELNKIKEHPMVCRNMAEEIRGIKEATLKVIEQEHERFNGKGYPNRLSDGEIAEFSQIIGMVDVYEALSHERPFRKAYPPQDAIKEILTYSGIGGFEIKIARIFISRLGIYPIGSWVKLSTGEIGRVMRSNVDFPLRPVVNILFNMQGGKNETIRMVDLSKQYTVFIMRPLNEEELKGLKIG